MESEKILNYITGNSLIKVGNIELIGDSIEVLYFEFMPSFNRPLSFYEDD